MEKIVFITGGDGFIGSHLAKYLSELNYQVYALTVKDSSEKQRIENMKGIHIIEGDLGDYAKLTKQLPQNADALFHFAWAGVSPDTRDAYDIQKINLSLTVNAIQLAKAMNVRKFIFPGSTMEYSYSNQIINEKTTPSPQNVYGAVKIACRYMSEVLCRKYNIEYNYAVISGIYSEDRMDNNVISYTIKSLLSHQKPQLTKLEQQWDYVHINDVIKALFLIMVKGKNGAFYAIGHGDNWPLVNYIYTIRDIINPSAELGIGEVPYSDEKIPMSCVDLEAIKSDTGYKPDVSFEEGITKVINSIKERLK